MNLKLPSLATSIVGIALGVLVALNDQVLHLGQPWATGINSAVVWAGIFGVSVLAKPIFRSLVKVTTAEATFIAGALTIAQLVLGQSGIGSTATTIAQAVLVVGATLGFGPDVVGVVKMARERVRNGHPDRRGIDG